MKANLNQKAIKNILVLPHSKYKAIMPDDKLDVLFMEYECTEKYSPKTSKWVKSVKPTPSEWNVTHYAKGTKRTNRRIANYYETREQYPTLFEKGCTQGGVTQVGNTLVISGQNPTDIISAYINGEIPTANGRKYVK